MAFRAGRVPWGWGWALGALLGVTSLAGCTRRASEPEAQSGGASVTEPREVRPVHEVSEVPRPAVAVRSADLPGFTRGINLGNALEAPKGASWGVVLKEAHFDMAKAAGLDHVRLPAKFSGHAAAEAPYTIDAAFFEQVDWAIEQAKARGLSIIVDLHHYDEIMKEPDAHAERFVGLWSQIAARYKDQPPSVAFELLNEPNSGLVAERWNPLAKRALEVVRQTNPTRLVIVDCYFWANAEHLHTLDLPTDPNVVATFHMYQPILFTHQGAEWMEPEFRTRGVVFPGPPAQPLELLPAAEQTSWVRDWFAGYNQLPLAQNPGGPKTVFDHFQLVEKYIQERGHRVYLGEFGAIDRADPKSRENYVRLVREEAERRNIGWAYWDDGGSFEAMHVEDGTWVPYLKSALLD